MINIIKRRAPKGGAIGANGEWYEGGKFINSVADNAKSIAKKAKKASRKQEIEPWVWALPPEPGKKPLLRHFLCGVYTHFIKGVVHVSHRKPETREYYNETDEQVKIWVDAYNRGERWE